MRRVYALMTLMVMVVVAQSFIAVPAFAACEVKLGIVTPLSGAAAQYGIAMRDAVEMVAASTTRKAGCR